jgi:hypothetical protein
MSKFEKYLDILKEHDEAKSTLVESVNTLLEELGHVDDVDAHDLGLKPFTKISAKDIVSAIEKMCRSGKCDVDKYMHRLEKAYKGRMSIQDREQIKKLLDLSYWPRGK